MEKLAGSKEAAAFESAWKSVQETGYSVLLPFGRYNWLLHCKALTKCGSTGSRGHSTPRLGVAPTRPSHAVLFQPGNRGMELWRSINDTETRTGDLNSSREKADRVPCTQFATVFRL